MPQAPAPRLRSLPLAPWERDGVRAALVKAGLPADDVGDASLMVWRFETDDVPVGFAGLRIHGPDAELRAVLTLPPLRQGGLGRAMVADLEAEAMIHKCRAIYLATTSQAEFFARLGYARCAPAAVPETIRARPQFNVLVAADAAVMRKQLPAQPSAE
jgi:N-acetylglutamate synthase-like GNAT family acetyltransferase